MKTRQADILVVEDDRVMADLVTGVLVEKGHRVKTVKSAESALEYLTRHRPDLLITDLGLPMLSGYDLCRFLKEREATAHLPVIMLTVMRHEADKVKGLNVGADYYLTKPFSAAELLARVDALLRRVSITAPRPDVATVGNLEVDFVRHEARVDGKPARLRPMEFKILAHLAKHLGKVVRPAALLSGLWEEEAKPSGETVRSHVKHLRQALGPAARYIKVVRGVGFKLGEDS